MTNKCTNPRCPDKGDEMIDIPDKRVYECKTCKSRSCSVNDIPCYWYKCRKCKNVGIYDNTQENIKCEYCGADEVTL